MLILIIIIIALVLLLTWKSHQYSVLSQQFEEEKSRRQEACKAVDAMRAQNAEIQEKLNRMTQRTRSSDGKFVKK